MLGKKKSKEVKTSKKSDKIDVSSRDMAEALNRSDSTNNQNIGKVSPRDLFKRPKREKPQPQLKEEPKEQVVVSDSPKMIEDPIEEPKKLSKREQRKKAKEEAKQKEEQPLPKKGRFVPQELSETEKARLQEQPADSINKTTEQPEQIQPEPGFQWANTEEYELKLEKENKKKKRGRKGKNKQEEVLPTSQVSSPNIEAQELNTDDKKEIKDFFDKGKNEDLKVKGEKNKKSKRNSKKQKRLQEVKDQRVYRYDNKRYTKVEDFITYLNEHYLDIEEISEEILNDENFFGWVNKNSGMFTQSLKEFKKIKEKIENKK